MLSQQKNMVARHPDHGGNLTEYASHYQIDQSKWLDLSTGINPNGYPVDNLPVYIFNQLPDDNDGLTQAAQNYYQNKNILMVPGSCWAISELPWVLKSIKPIQTVLLPQQGFSGHVAAWQNSDVKIESYDGMPCDIQIKNCDVCVLINPNNPTAQWYTKNQVIELAGALSKADAFLVVDEAFIDTQLECSVSDSSINNLIVLRSLGKFFGLAGLRVGSVIAGDAILTQFRRRLPKWPISNASRFIAKQALQDKNWIEKTKQELKQQSHKLYEICDSQFGSLKAKSIRRTDLFVTVYFSQTYTAKLIHHKLCQLGIYTRLLDDESGIRIGLPQNIQLNWIRLEHTIESVVESVSKELIEESYA